MIVPCGYRIVVRMKSLAEVDEVFARAEKAGLELLKDHDDHLRKEMGVDKGEVVSIGPTAFKDFGGDWCKVGDTVVFAKYAGKLVEDTDKKKFMILNDEDVIAVLKD